MMNIVPTHANRLREAVCPLGWAVIEDGLTENDRGDTIYRLTFRKEDKIFGLSWRMRVGPNGEVSWRRRRNALTRGMVDPTSRLHPMPLPSTFEETVKLFSS